MTSKLSILASTPFILLKYLFDILCLLPPWGRPVKEWTVNQAVRVRTVRLFLLYWSLFRAGDRLKLKPGRERERFEVIHSKSPDLYKGPLSDVTIEPGMIGATWTPARPQPTRATSRKTTVALHFHGGGFVIGDGRDHDTGFLAQTLVRQMGCTYICTPQYRLSSHKGGQFPAALQDALTSYLHLVNELCIPASQIILSGDSAGGNIVLGLLRYISEYGGELGIPVPAAAALWSPWTDVGVALDPTSDIKSFSNYASDYLVKEFAHWGAYTVTAHGSIDGSGPYLSPLHHPFDMGGKIPLFVHGGEREVVRNDIEALSKAFESKDWPVRLVISKGCPHDVLLLGSRLGFHEEAEAVARDAKAFFSSTTALQLEGSD
ncbi:hypothetical protein GQX73_g6977 [Xylaria multiplex]|uniref:Alpha/beta hydrolase fold-3 domain-containing protein n=1 Tax=Xylaria multiplex TaxID=323545 RepID=A0A7C8IP50_9PEZI|nr:hypothetical protein GQX73_g6977 [Xylaria multiplex]